ncbi:MAG: substrate-binding domain-containing protein [Bacteroidales bacterium]|nr:substrate-binding domain-containing protein [Bacteroidales bacterium]
MITVLLLNDLSREPSRQLIKGISRYDNKRGGWRYYQVPPAIRDDQSHIEKIVTMVRDLKIDAIFGQWMGINVEIAKSLDIPIVLYQRSDTIEGFALVKCDNEAVGEMAADYLSKYKSISLACCGFKNVVWSAERMKAFKERLGNPQIPELNVSDDERDWQEMIEWLKTLPKPTGVFCCNDVCAKMLIYAAISSGLKIPEEVSVLGVDDDSFICNITFPSISTIKLDFEGIGYTVGEYLSNAIDKGNWDQRIIRHYPVKIVERSSTIPLQSEDKYVNQVISFFKEHYAEDIDIQDAIRGIPLSRRSIEKRFRKIYGDRTMNRILTEMRIERMKELLEKTQFPIFNIALMAGFKDNTNINRVFRSFVGYSPKEYREIHR